LQDEHQEAIDEAERVRVADLHARGRHEYFFGEYMVWDQL